ncbi:hypothetical protein BCR34DRAFT_390158 [Clohesyomyces aquaticus]|uniref:Secreted protein n=1 Tax=Clohesyomyces aquaticus TaxID=1231657 RepID=A0A1Y1ZEN3_9PLEO|nr:hypothetical protein BCR34DRAFT_390158 [Clohesyomyces aquaticus]
MDPWGRLALSAKLLCLVSADLRAVSMAQRGRTIAISMVAQAAAERKGAVTKARGLWLVRGLWDRVKHIFPRRPPPTQARRPDVRLNAGARRAAAPAPLPKHLGPFPKPQGRIRQAVGHSLGNRRHGAFAPRTVLLRASSWKLAATGLLESSRGLDGYVVLESRAGPLALSFTRRPNFTTVSPLIH